MGSNADFEGNLMLLTQKTVLEIQTYLGFQHQYQEWGCLDEDSGDEDHQWD